MAEKRAARRSETPSERPARVRMGRPKAIHLYRDSASEHSESERLGELLRQRREERGLTHREVASSADVSVSYVGMVERGERRPTREKLIAVLDALDTASHAVNPRVLTFSIGDQQIQVIFKPVNLAEMRAPMRRWADDEVARQQQMRTTQGRLGRLLSKYSAHPAAARNAYVLHCSGDPHLSDSELPDQDVILGELAQVLAGSPGLALRLHDQFFGPAADAFRDPE